MDCRVRVPALPLSAAVSISVPGGSAVPGPPSPPLASCVLVAQAVGGFSSPPPPFVLPQSDLSRCGPSGGVVPPGSSTTPVVSAPCGESTPLPTLWRPPRVFRHSRGLATPLLVPHSGGLVGHSGGLASPVVALHSRGFAARFFLPASLFPSLRRSCPMAAPRSRLVSSRGGGFPGVAPAVPHTPLYRSCAAFFHDPWWRCQRFSSLLWPPRGHPFLLRLRSRRILRAPAETSALPPLHPSLASSLSSWTSLSRRSPQSPLLLTWSCPRS